MSKSTASAPKKDKAKTVSMPKREITFEERYQMIAEAAYYRAEKRGFAGEGMAEDWLAAEADIDRMLGQEGIDVIDGTIESRVRSTLAYGPANIADQVRSITLQALSEGEMDKESIGRVAAAVVSGAKEFTANAAEGANALREAIRGLDEALASAAEATHLALQEAVGRSNEFSQQAMQKSLHDLDALESMFIETLTEGAKDATGFAQATLTDLAEHARVGGTAVGKTVEPALKQLAHVFTDTLQAQADTGAEALRKQYALLSGIANGIIKGVVDHLHATDASGKPFRQRASLMLSQAIGALHDLGRLHDIAVVLIRYGFGDQVRRIGLAGVLEQAGRALHWRAPEELARLEPPARVRRVLEELGPTFVKLGQVLATRVDLFPPEWIEEFGKLQDEAPPVPFDKLRAQLAEDLGAAPEEVFAALDVEPLAAASLAQVHRAELAEGGEIVLKIRRPGIRKVVEADLRLLTHLAGIVESEAPELRRYRPRDIVRQFTVSLRRELDFAAECRNAERIAANFSAHPEIIVPRVHWQWVGERLNAQDLIHGIPGRDLAAVDAAGMDRKLLAQRGASAVLKMMLEDGFFHADPHPGNVFYLPENRIAFIDFGMVGRLSEERRYQVAVLLHGLVSHDAEAVAEILLAWGEGAESSGETELDRLKNEIDAFVDHYRGVPLKQLDLAALLSDLVAILREHGLALPPDLTLLTKAFVTLEGMGRQLDPDFDMAASAAPFLERIILAHNAPANLARRGWKTLNSAVGLLASLPQDLGQLLRAARRGRLQMHIEVTPLKQFGQQVDRAASRLAVAIVTAALIIGSAIVMNVGQAPGDLPAVGLAGFLGAVVGGVWLLVSILRSGRSN